MVTCEHMNTLLKLVLRLIMNNVSVDNAFFMTRIASYTQQIIINSSEEMLRDPYLPLTEKVSYLLTDLLILNFSLIVKMNLFFLILLIKFLIRF